MAESIEVKRISLEYSTGLEQVPALQLQRPRDPVSGEFVAMQRKIPGYPGSP